MPRTKKESRNLTWSLEQKRVLARLVKGKESLWRVSHKDYKKTDAKEAAWRTIALKMESTVSEAKKQWKSLRDGLRYRQIGKKVGKSGDPLDSGDDDDDRETPSDDASLTSWELFEDLRFLIDNRPQRQTLSSNASETEENEVPLSVTVKENDGDDEFDSIIEEIPTLPKKKSNYEYMVNKKAKKSAGDDVGNRMAVAVQELVEIRKKKEDGKQDALKHLSIYQNLDRMLCQLPASEVEDLNMAFTKMAYDAIVAQRQKLEEGN